MRSASNRFTVWNGDRCVAASAERLHNASAAVHETKLLRMVIILSSKSSREYLPGGTPLEQREACAHRKRAPDPESPVIDACLSPAIQVVSEVLRAEPEAPASALSDVVLIHGIHECVAFL